MANNLRNLRRKLGWSQEQAAQALQTTVPQYGKLERGERRLSDIWIDRAASAFGVDPGDVVENRRKMVPVVGYVGAGAAIMPFREENLDEVEAPPGAPEGVVCVEVRGDSMYPRYFDRERIFYVVQDRPPQDFLGCECVVQLADGRMFLKILRRGTRMGVFSLESWNAPMVENVVVEWAAPVRWTERRS
mgnify:CR=1 FL=1